MIVVQRCYRDSELDAHTRGPWDLLLTRLELCKREAACLLEQERPGTEHQSIAMPAFAVL